MGTETNALQTMPEWARKGLANFADPTKYELLLPAIPIDSQLGYGYVPSVSVVTIDGDPNNGEIFNVGVRYAGQVKTELFAYAKPGLLKLASAAGIQIRTERVDNRRNPDYCEMRALGAMRTETGQPMIRTGTKGIFMPDIAAEAWRTRVKRNEGKAQQYKKSETVLKAEHDGEMAAFKKHLLRRTEAGAITAVIRELLGVKGAQTLEQITRPKVLIRVDFRPDHNDPVVRNFLLQQADAATRVLYGSQPASTAEIVHEVEPDEETVQARTHAALNAAEPAAAVDPEPTEDELVAEVEKGCDILGLNLLGRNDLFVTHKGDLKAMLADLSARVEKMQSGGN